MAGRYGSLGAWASLNVFTASDEDARGQIFWSLRGEDAAQFVRSSTDLREPTTGLTGPDEPIAIRFAEVRQTMRTRRMPTSDSVYKVDPRGQGQRMALRTLRDLTVFVMNVNEAGDVKPCRQPASNRSADYCRP